MERQDRELIKACTNDRVLQDLYKEHVEYEKVLAKMENKPFLTPKEEMKKKELQKKKLHGKDQIEQILRKYRNGGNGGK